MDIIHISRGMDKHTLALCKKKGKLAMAYKDGLMEQNIRDSSIKMKLRVTDNISFPTKINTMEKLKKPSYLVKEYYHIMKQE
jgi:hypothetical protein